MTAQLEDRAAAHERTKGFPPAWNQFGDTWIGAYGPGGRVRRMEVTLHKDGSCSCLVFGDGIEHAYPVDNQRPRP
jgi:hypothetical protein